MIQLIKKANISCRCAKADGPRVCYLLLPEPLLDESDLIRWAHTYACSMVELSGMEWNDDLTPWPSKGFGGKAEDFLHTLRTEVMPAAETALLPAGSAPERLLTGISLSGLFAVWTWTRGTEFRHIASISGSFWYDGFAEWLAAENLSPKSGCAYLSLGDKESQSKNARFRSVGERTAQVATTLQRAGIRTQFELTPGTHFSPIVPRIERALECLKSLCAD